MNTIILHLGSNLGNRIKQLEDASMLIGQYLGTVKKRSSFYQTEPWLGPDPFLLTAEAREQNQFLNVALMVETMEPAEKALDVCMKIEKRLGRERKHKWSARAIDIDLIFCDDQVINTPDLIIPHPWMQDRRFVLEPLVEIIPNWRHPVLHKTSLELLTECVDTGRVEKMER